MDMQELNLENLAGASGGILMRETMEALVNAMRLAKSQGVTLEQFLAAGGDEPQSIEFCKFMWDRI